MFHYSGDEMMCEQAALQQIAHDVGTPCYVYSAAAILSAYQAYDHAFAEVPHQICFAVKANSNLAVLALLARAGAGFDIVSAGELYRVLQAGGDAGRVVFSGVGKTEAEMEYAIRNGTGSFNCESEPELGLLNKIAQKLNCTVQFALRVNPDVNASTHPYISTGLKQHKFGVDLAAARSIYERSRENGNLAATGVSCHIGSQMLDLRPMVEAAEKVLALANELKQDGHPIDHLDLGGGLGIAYAPEEQVPAVAQLAAELRRKIAGSGLRVMVEPGRSIVGPAGVLLTKVLYRKNNGDKNFVIVDAAMNDLIRPALYQAHHEIVPAKRNARPRMIADVVGPVCESGDFLARNREMACVEPGDLLMVEAAGAYGFSQASNYNSRPRAAEVLVKGAEWQVVRDRESFADLVRGERI